MRRLYITVTLAFLLSAALLAVSTAWNLLSEDRTLPEIQCPESPLKLSVHADESQLLAGVTASDEKDGDLTDKVFVQDIGKSGQEGMATVTYAVVDSDNHVATANREVHYTDYQAPRFSIAQPLHYTVGSPVIIRDRVQAQDSVDGNISSQIRIFSEGLSANMPGVYPVTLEVTNSLGNTARVTVDVVIEEKTTVSVPKIYLTDYLVYATANQEFDASKYLESVSGGEKASVRIAMPENGLVSGMNVVTFTCAGSNGTVGTTMLYVVVE